MGFNTAKRGQAIYARLARGPGQNYLRDWISGVIIFAVVAGVATTDRPTTIVLLRGDVADGFAMPSGSYSGTKAELGGYAWLVEMERRHIAEVPEGNARSNTGRIRNGEW